MSSILLYRMYILYEYTIEFMWRKQILCPIELADHFPFLAFLQIRFISQESIISYLESSSRFCHVSNKTSKIDRFEKFYNRQLIKYEIADWTPSSSKIEEKELHKSWRSLSTLFWFSPFPFSNGERYGEEETIRCDIKGRG